MLKPQEVAGICMIMIYLGIVISYEYYLVGRTIACACKESRLREWVTGSRRSPFSSAVGVTKNVFSE